MDEPSSDISPTTSQDVSEGQELETCLAGARKAYEENDSQAVSDLCSRALELDPGNAEAWGLLARFGGWDSKLYVFDIGFAVDSAKHALSLLPEEARYEEAAEIYFARKRQVALMLEAAMMTPSYTGSKQAHEVMQWWERMLVEIPYLNTELLEGEISLCSNLCARSRMGIMPADRLVYTAYTTFNGKEPYGETFRKALEKRLAAEQGKRDEAWNAASKQAKALCQRAQVHLAGEDLGEGSERAVLEEDRKALAGLVETFRGLTNYAMYRQQTDELQRQRAKLPKYKLFKVREADARIADLQKKLAEIEAQLEPEVHPIGVILAALDERLA